MRINFKTILIIFLVALLGGAAGTYAVLEINDKIEDSNKASQITTDSKKEVFSDATYTNISNSTYSEAIAKTINSVVEITNNSETTSTTFFGQQVTQDSTSLGSGVIISEDGYIVTNAHVVNNAKSLTVKLQNSEEYEGTIIGYDTKTDLALVKIEASGLSFSYIADSDDLILGQEVIAIGNALGKGTSCSNGIISAINKELTLNNYTMTLIQTNAAVNNGNSGGGLFDLNGNLVGVVNAKTSYSSTSTYSNMATVEGMGYAIPSNTVKATIEELKENGYVKDRPALGVKIYTSEYNTYYGVEGLVVSEVVEGSGSEKAGIQKGDIITAIDGNVVNKFSELAKILDSYQIGDTVTLTINRNDKEIKVNVTLQESTN